MPDAQDKNIEEPKPTDDVAYLLSYTRHLERQKRRLETEKQVIESERLRLQREINNLRNELDRLRSPPLYIGTVIEIISEKSAVVKSTTGPTLVVGVSKKIANKLKPNMRVALNQRSFAVVDILPEEHDPFVKAMEVETRPNVSYKDIGGLDEQIQQIREIVELPLTNIELFDQIGIEPPKGVLLYGPPGTGKTLLAKAVANETNARFIRVIGSELVQKFIGEGARIVREIFAFAQQETPTILFIDELDAIGSKRLELATSGDREVQRTLMQLLSELDGFEPRGNVQVIAATNRPDILDPALLRPGRFDRHIEVPVPDFDGRLEILKIHTRKMNLSKKVSLAAIAEQTENASGAELKSICTEAGMFAIRNKRTKITPQDFQNAIEKVLKNHEQIANNYFS